MPEKRKRADADTVIESGRFSSVKPDFNLGPARFPPVKPDSAVLSVLKNLYESTRSAETLTPSVPPLSSLQSKILNLAVSLRESIVGGSVSGVGKAVMILRVLDIIHQLTLKNGLHISSKQLFHCDVELFKNKEQVEACVDDIACMLCCTWSSLFVVFGDDLYQEGYVAGRLRLISKKGNTIDCRKDYLYGMGIPSDPNWIGDMQSDALFILLVEHNAAYRSLIDEKFYNRFPCIIMTGNEKPELGARLFLMQMVEKLKLPVLALVNCFPKSLENLLAYGYGTDIKWLGLRPSDFDKYKIPTLPMTERDVNICKNLLKKDSLKNKPGWVKELELMVKIKQKSEIDAFFQHLSKSYLPLKLQEKDWL